MTDGPNNERQLSPANPNNTNRAPTDKLVNNNPNSPTYTHPTSNVTSYHRENNSISTSSHSPRENVWHRDNNNPSPNITVSHNINNSTRSNDNTYGQNNSPNSNINLTLPSSSHNSNSATGHRVKYAPNILRQDINGVSPSASTSFLTNTSPVDSGNINDAVYGYRHEDKYTTPSSTVVDNLKLPVAERVDVGDNIYRASEVRSAEDCRQIAFYNSIKEIERNTSSKRHREKDNSETLSTFGNISFVTSFVIITGIPVSWNIAEIKRRLNKALPSILTTKLNINGTKTTFGYYEEDSLQNQFLRTSTRHQTLTLTFPPFRTVQKLYSIITATTLISLNFIEGDIESPTLVGALRGIGTGHDENEAQLILIEKYLSLQGSKVFAIVAPVYIAYNMGPNLSFHTPIIILITQRKSASIVTYFLESKVNPDIEPNATTMAAAASKEYDGIPPNYAGPIGVGPLIMDLHFTIKSIQRYKWQTPEIVLPTTLHLRVENEEVLPPGLLIQALIMNKAIRTGDLLYFYSNTSMKFLNVIVRLPNTFPTAQCLSESFRGIMKNPPNIVFAVVPDWKREQERFSHCPNRKDVSQPTIWINNPMISCLDIPSIRKLPTQPSPITILSRSQHLAPTTSNPDISETVNTSNHSCNTSSINEMEDFKSRLMVIEQYIGPFIETNNRIIFEQTFLTKQLEQTKNRIVELEELKAKVTSAQRLIMTHTRDISRITACIPGITSFGPQFEGLQAKVAILLASASDTQCLNNSMIEEISPAQTFLNCSVEEDDDSESDDCELQDEPMEESSEDEPIISTANISIDLLSNSDSRESESDRQTESEPESNSEDDSSASETESSITSSMHDSVIKVNHQSKDEDVIIIDSDASNGNLKASTHPIANASPISNIGDNNLEDNGFEYQLEPSQVDINDDVSSQDSKVLDQPEVNMESASTGPQASSSIHEPQMDESSRLLLEAFRAYPSLCTNDSFVDQAKKLMIWPQVAVIILAEQERIASLLTTASVVSATAPSISPIITSPLPSTVVKKRKAVINIKNVRSKSTVSAEKMKSALLSLPSTLDTSNNMIEVPSIDATNDSSFSAPTNTTVDLSEANVIASAPANNIKVNKKSTKDKATKSSSSSSSKYLSPNLRVTASKPEMEITSAIMARVRTNRNPEVFGTINGKPEKPSTPRPICTISQFPFPLVRSIIKLSCSQPTPSYVKNSEVEGMVLVTVDDLTLLVDLSGREGIQKRLEVRDYFNAHTDTEILTGDMEFLNSLRIQLAMDSSKSSLSSLTSGDGLCALHSMQQSEMLTRYEILPIHSGLNNANKKLLLGTRFNEQLENYRMHIKEQDTTNISIANRLQLEGDMTFLNNYMEWINSTSESDFYSKITASPEILQWVAPYLNAPYNYWESAKGLDFFSFTFSKYSTEPDADPTLTIHEVFQNLHYRVNVCTEGLNGSCHYFLRPICPAAPSKYIIALHRLVLRDGLWT